MNNFQLVIGEPIVSKVQGGGKTRVKGSKAPLGSPSDPPMLVSAFWSQEDHKGEGSKTLNHPYEGTAPIL